MFLFVYYEGHSLPSQAEIHFTFMCSFVMEVHYMFQVSFLPYICEIFLCHMIKVEQSSACILKGCLELSLVKVVPQLWKELSLKLTKEEMDHKRQEAIKDVEEEEKKKASQRKGEHLSMFDFVILTSFGMEVTALQCFWWTVFYLKEKIVFKILFLYIHNDFVYS